MKDNKLSELSKPAWIVGEKEIADFMGGDEALLVRGHDAESTEPALRMYSQEYVSALLAELEAKDKRIAELEAKLATPVRLPELCGDGENDTEYTEGLNDGINQSAKAVRANGFKCVGDE